MISNPLYRVLPMLMCILCPFLFSACSDDETNGQKEPLPLLFARYNYETMTGSNYLVNVHSGNRDYNLRIADPDILTCDVDLQNPNGCGYLILKGKKRGTTQLFVTDNVTQDKATLTVKVTDSYADFTVHNSNHPALQMGLSFYLVDNDAHDFYLLNNAEKVEKPTDRILAKGTYSLSIEGKGDTAKPHLTLTYPSDEQGRLTDAAIPPTAHKFDISGSKEMVYTILARQLHFDWNDLRPKTKALPPTRYSMQMKEAGTTYEIAAVIATKKIPEGILP